jgi:hypothetical protein
MLKDVVIPGGHDRVGMQYVSRLEAPSTVVMLYHWSDGQAQATAEEI